jgi:HEAT repeat protein
LLADPDSKPTDLLAFAGIWTALDRTPRAVDLVADAIIEGGVADPYARAILVRMIGRCADGRAIPALRDRVQHDPDPLVRRRAAHHLGTLATEADLAVLAAAARDESELVRCSVAGGLRDNPVPGADEVLRPLLEDPDLFTRRAAAVALLSRGDATMVDRIMDEMAVASIDTGWNYGRNLFVTMSEYLGPTLVDELGTDLSAWQAWWNEHRETHDLQASIDANRQAIDERLDKAPSSE